MLTENKICLSFLPLRHHLHTFSLRRLNVCLLHAKAIKKKKKALKTASLTGRIWHQHSKDRLGSHKPSETAISLNAPNTKYMVLIKLMSRFLYPMSIQASHSFAASVSRVLGAVGVGVGVAGVLEANF